MLAELVASTVIGFVAKRLIKKAHYKLKKHVVPYRKAYHKVKKTINKYL